MATGQLSEFVQHLRGAAIVQGDAGLTDGQLLECYLAHNDEAAITALVRRHGPMVWGVCRRALGNHHDAEDAFQVTFLVLARKASSIQPRERVASWLHGVASQTARKRRATLAQRRRREKQVSDLPEVAAPEAGTPGELSPDLDIELGRLPERYRAAILLCDIEGLTRKQAARRFGLPEGTLSGHLTRGRALLADRLDRRDAAPPAPPALVASTIKAAKLLVAENAAADGVVSPAVAALTEGVLKAMMLSKPRIVTSLVAGVVLALAACGSASLARQGAEVPARKISPAARAGGEPAGKKAGWREAYTVKHDYPVTLVACSASFGAAGDEGGFLFLWDTQTGQKRQLLFKGGKEEGENTSVDRLQFTPGGDQLFGVVHERESLFHCDLKDPKNPKTVGIKAQNPRFLGVSVDGETWLESYQANRVLGLRGNGWTANTVKEGRIKYEAEITHVVQSSDDKRLAVMTADGKLHLHDRETLKETHTIATKQKKLAGVQFSPDGERVALVGDGSFAKVFDATNGKEVATLKGHRGVVLAVAFGPDGKQVATGGDDNTARIWDAPTGKLLAVLGGHKGSVRSVAFDPGGRMVVTGSADKTVKAWKFNE